MQAPKFVKNKLTRLILTSGIPYTFTRYLKDEYQQRTTVVDETIELSGVFHEVHGYIKKTVSESSITVSSPQPMILANLENASLLKLDDVVVISGKTYKVTGVRDVENFGVAGDISLEVI